MAHIGIRFPFSRSRSLPLPSYALPAALLLLLAGAGAPACHAQTAGTAVKPTQDPQALAVINQVLAGAGGRQAIGAISDYTATGSITYHPAGGQADVNGSVTVRALGLGELRIDSSLPSGTRSSVVNGGISTKTEEGTVSSSPDQPPMDPGQLVLPYLLLNAALNGSGFNLLDEGTVQISGQSLVDIRLERFMPQASLQTQQFLESHTIDYFIDPTTALIAIVQDVVAPHVTRQLRYSNYQTTGGVLVPFSIGEYVESAQPGWQIQLTGVTFNSGLEDSEFQLQ